MANQTQVNEILNQNGLDFTITKVPLTAMYEGTEIASPYFGLVNSKTKTIINSVKEGYGISQTKEVVEMVLDGMTKFGDQISVQKAGSIKDGRRVYFQLKIEGNTRIGNDKLVQYVTIIDSNDGTTGLSVGIGDKNMWCENQFYKFYEAGQSKFRHTGSITEKIQEIPFLIETALMASLKQVRTYERFLNTPVSKELASTMVLNVLGYDMLHTEPAKFEKLTSKQLELMHGLYDNIQTEFNHSGENMWSLFGGITRYTTHTIKAPKRENGRIESLVGGTAYTKNQIAYNFALANS